jgi:hypothetical protein
MILTKPAFSYILANHKVNVESIGQTYAGKNQTDHHQGYRKEG